MLKNFTFSIFLKFLGRFERVAFLLVNMYHSIKSKHMTLVQEVLLLNKYE